MKDLGRFQELKESTEFRDFNSHRRMIPKYLEMLKTWNSFENKYEMSFEELKKLLTRHPVL
ncbi:YfbU family protein [Metabacillus sp. KIGAM252]|uniref:YfbU family protein n=1 Tax=Metabacillus flavus TaxID=2823519 RepID=A0ABS5LJ77_9BACI|nr:YfbU family protein [Metabacillus flavus]